MNDVAPSVVSLAVNTARNTIDNFNIVPPKSISGLKPDEIMRQYTSSLKTFGRFVTNDDETGVNLIDADGYAVHVKDPTSNETRLLNLTWNDLKLISSQELEARQQQAAQRRRAETGATPVTPRFGLPLNR